MSSMAPMVSVRTLRSYAPLSDASGVCTTKMVEMSMTRGSVVVSAMSSFQMGCTRRTTW